MRIFEINIYRDGGTIEFQIESDCQLTKVRLDTPFRGEPRELRINSISISKGSAEINWLLNSINEWWKSLSPDLQQKASEAVEHKGAFFNPPQEMLEAIDISRVLYVRDYVAKTYE